MKMHPSLTLEVIEEAARRQMFGMDNVGLCVNCGFEQDGCEPDARKYRCESCNERTVYGAEELLMMVAL